MFTDSFTNDSVDEFSPVDTTDGCRKFTCINKDQSATDTDGFCTIERGSGYSSAAENLPVVKTELDVCDFLNCLLFMYL